MTGGSFLLISFMTRDRTIGGELSTDLRRPDPQPALMQLFFGAARRAENVGDDLALVLGPARCRSRAA